jgi:hypothetical protein
VKTHRTQAWLWLVVALQVAIPAAYYVRADDRDDERFAWRMFSGVRMRSCSVRVFELKAGARPQQVPLSRSLHSSWIHALERGRRRVMERFLATRCGGHVERAVLERRCDEVEATSVVERWVYDCARHQLRLHEGR